jgi:hypothetical protein
MISIIATACVNSKSKAGGRGEAEVKLPPKSARIKPELHRAHSADIAKADPLDAHAPDWRKYQNQIDAVRAPLSKQFYVEGYGPFIIASNLTREHLTELEEKTIRSSYNAFYKDYFSQSPSYITTIYLFKNQIDYIHYSHKLFNENPTTPYGYYRSNERVMLMNISTGTGTLVHEMVHALIDADFPAMPTWFNEGFASLFEQSKIEDGSIQGLNNWRYPIFKHAITANEVVKLRQLIEASNDQFYDDKDGYNYAEARYLCYYLQEKGLLRAYYAQFKQKHGADPSGLKTLEEVLKKDIDSFEKEWLEWARNLPVSSHHAQG